MPTERTCIICSNVFTSIHGRLKCDKCYVSSAKCCHGTKKGRCKIDGCDGKEICIHKNHKQKCKICKPNMHIVDSLNAKIISFMNGKKIRDKTQTFILEYSSAPDLLTLKSHFDKNLQEHNLKIKDCHLDHIRPKSQFDLSINKQLKMCCHYKNLQFINAKENLKKANKYNSEGAKIAYEILSDIIDSI